jgi:hypothetical protein
MRTITFDSISDEEFWGILQESVSEGYITTSTARSLWTTFKRYQYNEAYRATLGASWGEIALLSGIVLLAPLVISGVAEAGASIGGVGTGGGTVSGTGTGTGITAGTATGTGTAGTGIVSSVVAGAQKIGRGIVSRVFGSKNDEQTETGAPVGIVAGVVVVGLFVAVAIIKKG